eukprot:8249305-Ditylum_brightwellii.AAC.1
MDATKVAEVVDVSTAFSACLIGAFPDHKVSYDEDASTWLLSGKQKASEIKMAVISAQDIAANITPMKVIAARPQTTNERCNEYNKAVVKAVQHTGADVVSVVFDRLDAEQTYTNNVMISFLCENGNIVSMGDPNHVAKCI